MEKCMETRTANVSVLPVRSNESHLRDTVLKTVQTSINRLVRFSLLCLTISAFSASALASIQITDDSGKEITLPNIAQKIISLAPHITELLYESGAGDQVIGVVKYSDYPEAAKTKTNVGSYNNINIEKIIALQPDLIVAYSGGNPPMQLKQLEDLGIPVYHSNPETIPDIIQNIRNLGRMTGHSKAANQHADQLQQHYQTLSETYAHLEPVSIFIQIWHEPLLTVDNGHIIGEVVELCGGKNVFPSMVSRFANVSLESVIAQNPQSIMLRGGHGTAKPVDVSAAGWSSLQASQNQQIITIDEDLLYRASGRLIAGTEDLCKKLDNVRHFYAANKVDEFFASKPTPLTP